MDGLDDAGTLVAGGLAAREVSRAAGQGAGHHAGGAHDAHHLHGSACANCATPLTGEFCNACGQAAHLHRDITGFAHDVLHGVFHFEGKFWTTLPMLAFRPGQLTRRYVDGERQKFVTPMAMFLFSVFLMFAVVSNLPGWIAPGEVGATPGKLDGARREIGESIAADRAKLARLEARRAAAKPGEDVAGLERNIRETEGNLRGLRAAARFIPGQAEASPRVLKRSTGEPAAAADADLANETAGDIGTTRLKASAAGFDIGDWVQRKGEHAKENPKLLFYKMKSAGYKYSWALIPMSLPFLWVMFAWRRRFGLYDHAVFATYSIAFMSLLVVVLTIIGYVFGGAGRTIAWTALFLVPPVHMYKQLRHGYELRRFSAAWRTVALLHIVSFTSLAFFLLLLYLGLAD